MNKIISKNIFKISNKGHVETNHALVPEFQTAVLALL